MFFLNFKYTLKALLRNKALVFWTLAFPLIMALFFNMAFSNIEKSETFDAIPVAVISNEYYENNESLKSTMDQLSDESNDERVFSTKYVTEDEAKELLNKEEISGYIIFEENSQKVVVTKNGVNQTIIKFVVEEVVQSQDTVEIIEAKINEIMNNRENLGWMGTITEIFKLMSNNEANMLDTSDNNLSYMMIEYYTLVAMTCLYGGILGAVAINWCLANMTNVGKRLSMTPVSKIKLVLSSTLAGYLLQVIGIALLFIFTAGVLHINYGEHLDKILLLAVIGSFAGTALGVAVTAALKISEGAKTGIIIGFSMLGCFFAGMMGVMMKYVIDKNVPIINKINPANMITDGFYSLYYYDTFERYWTDIAGLLIFSGIMMTIAVLSLRKQKYESL
ncbi:MAG: ABC transporter permease [Clostridia bacterium]|nr:ABC transporter permease [Clostridia bacterium]